MNLHAQCGLEVAGRESRKRIEREVAPFNPDLAVAEANVPAPRGATSAA